jgi:hypothetical protein
MMFKNVSFGGNLPCFIFFFRHLDYAGIPVSYLGYFLIIFGVLGLLGVNIWVGGPLDKRLDKNQHQ